MTNKIRWQVLGGTQLQAHVVLPERCKCSAHVMRHDLTSGIPLTELVLEFQQTFKHWYKSGSCPFEKRDD